MKIIDILTSPWAIVPEKLQEICAIYRAHARGEKADPAVIKAAIAKKPVNTDKRYEVIDRAAVVPLTGIIAKRMNLFMDISGGVSTQIFSRALMDAAEDSDADHIVVMIDSPGGTVDGTQAAMQAVLEARKKKRVIAVIDGLGASAGYWIASAAEQIYLTDDTTVTGSIGVVATHEDWSGYEEKTGIRTTEITAGRYKRIAGQYAPLSPEGRAEIQDQVDQIYTIFVNDVAANRGRDVDTVLKDMADGRIFIGKRAIEAGLADGIRSLADVIAMLKTPASRLKTGAQAPRQGGNMEKVIVCGVECATQAEVDAAVQDAIAKAGAEGRAEAETGINEKLIEATAAGAKAERERIQAIESNALPGHEALVAGMKADGKTTGPEAAERILTAEKARIARFGLDLQADAPKPAPAAEASGTADSGKKEIDPREVARQARAYVAEQAKSGHRVSFADAVQAVMELNKQQ